jgi:hypothetical protein
MRKSVAAAAAMIVTIGVMSANVERAEARHGRWLGGAIAGAIVGGVLAGSAYHYYRPYYGYSYYDDYPYYYRPYYGAYYYPGWRWRYPGWRWHHHRHWW